MTKLNLEYSDNLGHPIAETELSADESHILPLPGDTVYINGKGFEVSRREFSFLAGNITISLIRDR